MRTIFFGSLCLFMSMIWFLPEAQAGISYYVTPNGSGSSCTQASPCSLNTGLSKAGPGDELVLKDGVYKQMVQTQRGGTSGNPIVLRAEHQHQAIIRPPLPAPNRARVLDIKHSYITVRGVKLDGSKYYHFLVSIVGGASLLDTIVIEENLIENSGGVGFSIQEAKNVIVRHNFINATGYYSSDPCCGSAFYVGSVSQTNPVSNLQIYGNTIRDATNNAIDLKDINAINTAAIHHNIIENHVWPWDHGHPKGVAGHGTNDGLMVVFAKNSQIHDNIFRNNESGSSLFRMRGNANSKVLRNVVLNSKNNSVARGDGVSNLAKSEVAFNTYCNLQTYNNHSDGIAGINIYDNKSNASQSVCDAEVGRIMNEMKNLPRSSNVIISSPSKLRDLSTAR